MTADTVIAYITHDDRPSIVGVNGVKRRGGLLPTVTCAEPHIRSGHGTNTFSATIFFWFSLPFKVTAQLPLRQHFGTTWPDHFSKADHDPAWGPIFTTSLEDRRKILRSFENRALVCIRV